MKESLETRIIDICKEKIKCAEEILKPLESKASFYDIPQEHKSIAFGANKGKVGINLETIVDIVNSDIKKRNKRTKKQKKEILDK